MIHSLLAFTCMCMCQWLGGQDLSLGIPRDSGRRIGWSLTTVIVVVLYSETPAWLCGAGLIESSTTPNRRLSESFRLRFSFRVRTGSFRACSVASQHVLPADNSLVTSNLGVLLVRLIIPACAA